MAEEDCKPLQPSAGCDITGLNLKSTGKRLPKGDGGGGHEFVTQLPQTGVEGIEYILMDDLDDPTTFQGTYVFNKENNSYVATSGGSTVTVDDALSNTSPNPVQNKVITEKITELEDGRARIKQVYLSFANGLDVPPVTQDIQNTAIPKIDIKLSDAEAANWGIVGLTGWEFHDQEPGGSRVNYMPVCVFTQNNQTTLTIRGVAVGQNWKYIKRGVLWVLMRHR